MNETCSCGLPRERGNFCRVCYPDLHQAGRAAHRIICPGRPDCDCDNTKRCGTCDRSKVACDASLHGSAATCCPTCTH